MPISFSSLSGGGASGENGFSLIVGSSGNTTYTFSTPRPAGLYSITSDPGDTAFDVYLITANNQSAGYANTTTTLEASEEFTQIVVYGAAPNEILTFEYKLAVSPETSGDVVDGAAPFLTSAEPVILSSIDDTTTVSGGNFAADVQIVFVGQDSIERPAKSIVRNSSTELIVTRPDEMPVDESPYSIRAINVGIPSSTTNVEELTDIVSPTSVVGGIETQSGGYIYRTFTSSSTMNVLAPSVEIEYLIIAGGGGGGDGGGTNYMIGAGGGAGGLVSGTATLNTNSYTVTVGAGGNLNSSGTNSSFTGFTTAIGGGGGRSTASEGDGFSGGSGGGSLGSNRIGGSGVLGQGFKGGNNGSNNSGAGGGGATQEGQAVSFNSVGGKGGDGSNAFSTWANAIGIVHDGGYFSGGGGGGSQAGAGGAGGLGGGVASGGTTVAAPANSGGGGAGADRHTSGMNIVGSRGGSGLVVVRFAA